MKLPCEAPPSLWRELGPQQRQLFHDARENPETPASPTPGTGPWKDLSIKLALNQTPDEDDWRALGRTLHELQAAHPMKTKTAVKKVPMLLLLRSPHSRIQVTQARFTMLDGELHTEPPVGASLECHLEQFCPEAKSFMEVALHAAPDLTPLLGTGVHGGSLSSGHTTDDSTRLGVGARAKRHLRSWVHWDLVHHACALHVHDAPFTRGDI